MKNIYVIPTSQPSRLIICLSNNRLIINHNNALSLRTGYAYQNIYITNSETPKIGDYGLVKNKYIRKIDNTFNTQDNDWNVLNTKRIILTTDLKLVADKTQPVSDEFLEWFVKNPSCEEVEVYNDKDIGYQYNHYSMIIPEENIKITNCGNKNCQSGVVNGVNPKVCKKCNSYTPLCKTPKTKLLTNHCVNYCKENDHQNKKPISTGPKQEIQLKDSNSCDKDEWINLFKNNSKEEILKYLIDYKFPL